MPPLQEQDIAGAVAAGAAVVPVQQQVKEASMPHSDSAVSLPGSNASSAQGPGTPIAPPIISGTRFLAIRAVRVQCGCCFDDVAPLLVLLACILAHSPTHSRMSTGDL